LVRRIGDGFRVIIAQPSIVGTLLREGIYEHLDGMYAVAPAWTMALVRAAQSADWDLVARYQQRLNRLTEWVVRYDLPCVTAIFNARGIPGIYGAAPRRQLDAEAREKLLAEPIVQDLLRGVAL
jgi:dihydrodipicolinate synthase/N-acetylneuraminate lyase